MEYNELLKLFTPFRTGDIVMSAGENFGDILIFLGRQNAIQHTHILVWLSKVDCEKGIIKVLPRYVDDESTILTFLGLAEKRKTDIVTKQKEKGVILYEPVELFKNAPILYIRRLSEKYLSDNYMIEKTEEFISIHHLRTSYAYGKLHILKVGFGIDTGPHEKGGVLCSENVYNYLHHLCSYPEFNIEKLLCDSNENIDLSQCKKNLVTPDHEDYYVVDKPGYMYVPDYFSIENNTHPVFDGSEIKVIYTKDEEEITVKHPYLVAFMVLIIVIFTLFLIISTFCRECSENVCPRFALNH